jgi:serine/threonine-protein kinase
MQFDQLGPYRLGKKLGQGGMGAVYAGTESASGEAAAIKVLNPGLAAEEGFRVRFEAEIESLKKLRHPNIVRLYGYGEQAGTLYYAMELVDGTSLEDELRAGRRFDWREVTAMAIKLCRALKHAHDHGVIHRDLKPANLLLTTEGDVKLSDFGIARLFGNTRLTSDGGVLGTAEYMAPEQADGRTVNDRCDQYSLGGVLYALLAGRPPFRAKTLMEMLQLQRYADPEPVTRFAPHTPAELARIIHQLLDKDPQKRFANTLMLARSLEAMERGLSISISRGDDFVIASPEVPDASVSSYSPLAPTLAPGQLADMQRESASAVPDDQATEATRLRKAEDQQQAEPPAPGKDSDAGGSRFTKVEESRAPHASALGDALAGLLAPQTLALVAALLALLGTGWYLMRPPTADALYRQIEAAAADDDVESVAAALPKIKVFLENYPDDSRVEKLRAIQDEASQANPVQRLYSEAKRYTFINPELALAKFQALVDVYDDDHIASDITRHYVKLARGQQQQLQKRINRYVSDGQLLLESRLTKANELATQNPAAARKIYQGIIELYAEKPWAAESVRRARAALEAAPDPQAAAK